MAEDNCNEVEGPTEDGNSYKLHTLFDGEIFRTLTKGIRIANCLRPKAGDSCSYEEVSSEVLDKIQDLAVSDTLTCSYCCISFDDQIQQRQHYKLDWHRYNLKQNLEGKKPVTEEKFDTVADDVSSISGSDTEEEDLIVDNVQSSVDDISIQKSESNSSNLLSDIHLRQPKIFFENEDGNMISLYKCVLYGKKDVPEKEKDLISLALECQSNPFWAVVMLGGGHFAAAIFEGAVPVVHKTFHCYTVRASQGGTQGSRDSKNATSHPKSAGASLRRYNEASLIQHVQDIMQTWSEQLGKCSRIFWRAAGPHNQSVLFGGKVPPLAKADPRLRSIPFPTRRPTFFEVQRVHKALSSLEIYGKANNYVDKFPVSPRSNFGRRERKPYNSAAGDANAGGENGKDVTPPPAGVAKAQSPKRSSGGRVIDRAKPRKSPSRPLPEMVQALATAESPGGSSSGEDDEGRHYEIIIPTLETFEKQELGEMDDGVSPEVKEAISEAKKQAKKGKKKKAAPAPQPVKKKEEEAVELDELLVKLARDIRAACESGDVDLLNLYVASTGKMDSEQKENGICPGESTEGLVNDTNIAELTVIQKIEQYIFEDGNSILHTASAHGDPVILRALLEAGFDPSLKNKKGQPPYAVSAHKEIRNTFRRFMAAYPDRYDYTKAQVPGPLTEELEKELESRALEKKRLARKAKKESKKAKIKEEEERSERERFLNLSEREKRALAAERRLLERSKKGQGKPVVISRCYQCAMDITGKTPFEYDVNRFCSMDCLKLHRAKSKPAS